MESLEEVLQKGGTERALFTINGQAYTGKLAKEFKTDSELAAFLGISRSTLSNWNARNSIDFPLLLGSLDDVERNAWNLPSSSKFGFILSR